MAGQHAGQPPHRRRELRPLGKETQAGAAGLPGHPVGRARGEAGVAGGDAVAPAGFQVLQEDHFRTDVSYLPDLTAYLDDLLRTRERLDGLAAQLYPHLAVCGVDVVKVRRLSVAGR